MYTLMVMVIILYNDFWTETYYKDIPAERTEVLRPQVSCEF